MDWSRPASGRLSPIRRLLCCLAASLTFTASAAAGEWVEVAFGPPDAPRYLRISAAGSEEAPEPAATPLGSLWKLFVHAYLVDSARPVADYRCTGRAPSEEAYCCAPGETIGRDAALAQSCGLYFTPSRIGVTRLEWRAYWSRRGSAVPEWLLDLDKLTPATEVSVPSLLAALAAIDGAARHGATAALQQVTLQPRARPLLSHLGNALRVKTWSWRDTRARRIGGFAGWQADGTPIWLRGPGTSATVIERAAPWLEGKLPEALPPDDACVQVRFFARYPLSEVLLDGLPAAPGPLRGHVETRFQNGQRLRFEGVGSLSLSRAGNQVRIEGRLGLDDYIARVVQREAAPAPVEAARALAVAARTYLARHAGHGAGCYEIDDDSRTQRVSPAPPSAGALAAARWSSGLVLSGVAGRYHLTKSGPGQLAWKDAEAWARKGLRWDEILERAYGTAGFAPLGESDAGECHPLPPAEAWLAGQQKAWRIRLAALPGFEPPRSLPRICRLDHGNPYADIDRGRIYATGVGSANERLSLAHEYLHFALANHPLGRDEDFVEGTARKLLGTP